VRAFNQAIAISRERDLKDDLALLTADVARSQFDVGDYAAARRLFTEALRDGSGRRATEIRIRLAATLLNLGDALRRRTPARIRCRDQGGRRSLGSSRCFTPPMDRWPFEVDGSRRRAGNSRPPLRSGLTISLTLQPSKVACISVSST
jgi:hypothetical protein